MAEQKQELNMVYAYNSLMDRYMEVVKENSYKDAIIATQQETIKELQTPEEDTEDE